MKANAISVTSLLLFGMLSPISLAQEKTKSEEKPKSEVPTTPVKAQIVFTEYDGDKKVKSLPYTLYINAADAPELRPGWVRLRMGSRVPIYRGGNTENMTYLDVGTNIDARAAHTPEGHFLVYLKLERSWVEGDVLVPMQKPPEQNVPADPHAGSFREPIVRQFTSELDLRLREGQTMESTMATDPLSGRVFKVEVSLSAVK